MESFRKYIEDQRKRSGISEEELIEKSGMDRKEYRQFCRGKTIPSNEKLKKMCDVLGMRLEQMTGDADEENAMKHLDELRRRGKMADSVIGLVMILLGLVLQGISRMMEEGSYGAGVMICLAVFFMIYGAERMMRAKGQKE
jgi:transcriptional regulator with XRE-family HTH domain